MSLGKRWKPLGARETSKMPGSHAEHELLIMGVNSALLSGALNFARDAQIQQSMRVGDETVIS